ncbi:Hypothetical predicted protein [Cloeon dipterum]|uniref:Uncharacterized protein n=1 Tax=Cloeon dipterum TaxID=197152 RepID=A0A8S1BWW0_9INSE|nr:Hypothetical predicted protein [Cloeon dipterum]
MKTTFVLSVFIAAFAHGELQVCQKYIQCSDLNGGDYIVYPITGKMFRTYSGVPNIGSDFYSSGSNTFGDSQKNVYNPKNSNDIGSTKSPQSESYSPGSPIVSGESFSSSPEYTPTFIASSPSRCRIFNGVCRQ